MNVLLVAREDENQWEVFPQVAEELRRMGVRCRLVHEVKPQLKHRIWTLGFPTTTISFLPLRKFIPSWGTIWQQEWLGKIEECRRLEKTGIPIPKWRAVYPDAEPDLTGFSEFVVVKPNRGAYGAYVRVMRRGKVRYRPLSVRGKAPSEALIAQEYIHTGPLPISYRVGTVFGEPIYAWRVTASHDREPFDTSKRGSDFFVGRSIVASSKGSSRFDLEVPADILALARQAHRAFPTIPLLGTDIVREEATGKLYVLEVNAIGWTFNLTSETGRSIQRDFGFDLFPQFGAAKAIARGLYGRLTGGWCLENQESPNVDPMVETEAVTA